MGKREEDAVTIPSHALVAAVELERRKQESSRRRAQLEENRRALEEARDALADEEQALMERVASAREERDQIQGKIESATRRVVELEGEIEKVKREVEILERRHLGADDRSQELSEAIGDLERELITARKEISLATHELEMSREALSRMDRKISRAGLKR